MLTGGELYDVFDDVVYDNNAQEVLKKLNEIDNQRDLLVSRWVWELIQNARGTAGSQANLQIEVVLGLEQLIFRHNGASFKSREIAHLILHGSSKHEPGDIGKFGSGFITTHLISRQVRVRGSLFDGQSFDFVLNRGGNDAAELRRTMETSKAEFLKSVDKNPSSVPSPFTTEYSYPLSPKPKVQCPMSNVGKERIGVPLESGGADGALFGMQVVESTRSAKSAARNCPKIRLSTP